MLTTLQDWVLWLLPDTVNDWSVLGTVATIIGIIIALILLWYTARDAVVNRKVNQATFWLELRKMFAEHNEVHLLLRRGSWSIQGTGPSTNEEWAKLEAYMGLFEHCMYMIDEELIDEDTLRNIYVYRVENIVANDEIVPAKLIKEGSSWSAFIRLVQRLKLEDLMFKSGKRWMTSVDGKEWMASPDGKAWQKTPFGKAWMRSLTIACSRSRIGVQSRQL